MGSGGPRIALTPIAVPTTVGNYSAAFSGLTISSEVQIALKGAGNTTLTKVAVFGTADGTIGAGSISGTFDPATPSTWPLGGVGVRFLGYVRGGATSSPVTTEPNSILYIQDANQKMWEPAYIALRVLGTVAVDLDVSGIGDPTGTGGTAWIVGGQATVGGPSVLGPNNGDTFRIQAGAGLDVFDTDGANTSISPTAGDTMLIGNPGALTTVRLRGGAGAGAGVILMGPGPINIGTDASDKTITIGQSGNGTQAVNVAAGTGGFNVTTDGAGGIRLTPGTTGVIAFPPRNVGAGNTTATKWIELAANGTKYWAIRAPDAMGTSADMIWPTADAAISGQVISSNAAGQLAFGSGITLGGVGALTLLSGSSGTATLDSGSSGNVDVGTGATAKQTRVGSTTGTATTAIRSGSGALTIVRNGVTWTWPNAQGTVNQALVENGSGTLSFQSFNKCAFGATVSVVTQAAQFIPPGSGITTSTTLNPGSVQAGSGTVSTFRCSFIGDVLNLAQTVTAVLLKNGAAVTGASIAAIAAQAGAQTGTVTFTPVAFVAGDIFTATILPSAALTAILTNVTAAAV